MNILHVVPTYLPATRYGGPIRSVHGLCAGLARRGHSVAVYTTNVDGPGVSAVPPGVPVVRDGVAITYFATGAGRRIYRAPALARALARSLSGFDVLHAHAAFLWPPAAAARAARRNGVPYVVSPRGMLVPELIARKSALAKRTWIELFERRNLADAAAVHVTSDIEREDLGRLGMRMRRVATIANGVDVPERIAGKTRMDHLPRPRVLYLGRINWKKGLEQLIPAMAGVDAAHLVIAGNDEEGLLPRLRTLAQASGVAARTHFVGPVEDAEKWALLAAADVVVLPSSSENFGIALLEAMGVGVPVVTTRTVGLAAAIASAECGLVLADERVATLRAAIDALLRDPSLRRQMGDNGRRLVHERYSWDTIARQFEGLYSEIVEAQRASDLCYA